MPVNELQALEDPPSALKPEVTSQPSQEPSHFKKIIEREFEKYRDQLMILVAIALLAGINIGVANLVEKNRTFTRQEIFAEVQTVIGSDFNWDVFHNFESTLNEMPEVVESLNPADLKFWLQLLETGYQQLNVNVNDVEGSIKFAELEGKTGDENSDNIITLDSDLLPDTKLLSTLAHEAAHLRAGHSHILDLAYRFKSEFAEALWSNKHTEAEASLMSLENLTYLYYSQIDAQIKSQLKNAAMQNLREIVALTHNYEYYQAGYTALEEGSLDDAVSDAYLYGFLPMLTLQRLVNNSETGVPYMADNLGLKVNDLPLTNTAMFLAEMGFEGYTG